MPKLIHTSSLGALEIVDVPGVIEPHVPFTVSDELAARLLGQPDLYQLAPTSKPSRKTRSSTTPSEGEAE